MAKRRPSSPEEAHRKMLQARKKAFEAASLPTHMAELDKNANIEATRAGDKREGQTVKQDSARRLDAFASLKDGMAKGAYDAARRYEEQLLIRRGENDRGPSRERVDRTAGFTTDAMVDAAIWIEAVNARLAPRDWWLLMELIAPSIERESWRHTVAFITGETHAHSQGAVVRAMTVNLRDAIGAHEKAKMDARRAA